MAAKKQATARWVKWWGRMVWSKPSRPGIYRLQGGGFLVRGRVTERSSKRRSTLMRVVRDPRIEEAQAQLDALKADLRTEVRGDKPQRQTFKTFAISLFRARVKAGDIKSAKGREKWEGILRVHLLPAFGDRRCDEITTWHIAKWRERVASMIASGYESSRTLRSGEVKTRTILLAPGTANTWIRNLKTICKAMTEQLDLHRDPAASLKAFDLSQHPTYTDEKPNSVTPTKAREFLEEMRALYAQHYAMTLLGFATGKRPSTLRPIRASGPDSDVDWEEGFVRFRRSHTRGDEFMTGTKTGTRERAYLPESVMAELKAHLHLLRSPPLDEHDNPPLWWREPMTKSELLFPARHGGPRTPSCLDKPFRVVSLKVGIKVPLTPRAMRRTFNDLARAAHVHDVVARSITGHATPKMQDHYSTAQAAEQRSAIGKVIDMVTRAAVA
jgi:hypothetical protein